jgi:rhodanese-related sulfurtransferase
MKTLLSLILLMLPLITQAQKSKGRLELLDPYAYQTKMIHMLGTLIDLRSQEEHERGTIKGSRNLEWESEKFKTEAPHIAKYKPVFLFCQAGYLSGEAAKWFLKHDFSTVIILDNGFSAWKEFGFPTTEQEDREQRAPGSYDPED